MSRKTFEIQRTDGARIFCAEWLPDTEPRADLLLVHGHGEHLARLEYVASAYAEAGFRVIGCDQRGHGRSAGRRGHVERFDELIDDLEHVIHEAGCGRKRPLCAHGHSMGGLVLLESTLRKPGLLHAIVTTSPWLRLRIEPPAWKQFLAKYANDHWPTLTMSTGLSVGQMASNPSLVLSPEEARLVHRRMSARMYGELCRAAASVFHDAAKFPAPVCLIQGLEDPVMDPAAVREFFNALPAAIKSRSKMVELPGRRHEPHNDDCRDDVLAVAIDWLNLP